MKITVSYAPGGAKLLASIRLAQNEAPLQTVAGPESVGELDVHHVELTKKDVTAAGFTALLQKNARATDTLHLWCLYPVWLELLDLLNLQPPLPDGTVPWPPVPASNDG